MRANVISSLDDLENYKNEWAKLYSTFKGGNPFLSWEWNNLWIKNNINDENIRIVIIYSQDMVVAIAPFLLKNKIISFLADPFFADYSDILLNGDTERIIDKIFESITQLNGWKSIDLSSIPGTSTNFQSIVKAADKYIPYTESECMNINPFIDTDGRFSHYFKSRKKSIRSEMVRTRNILNDNYKSWEFISAESMHKKLDIYSALVSFHLDRQFDKVGTSIFHSKENIDFFKDLICNESIEWKLDLSAIKVNGEYVSASISIIDKGIYYYWIPSFDKTFPKGSIGNFHLMLILEKCFESEIKRFDFMGGDENYKMKWTDTSYKNYKILGFKAFYLKFFNNVKKNIMNYLKRYKNNRILKPLWVKISKNFR